MNANMYRELLKQSMIPMIWAQFGHFHLGGVLTFVASGLDGHKTLLAVS